MCGKVHTYQPMVYRRVQRYDPTRTTTLRNKFASEMGKRFRDLRGLIRQAIVERDVFGMQGNNYVEQTPALVGYALPPARSFDFPRSGDKVSAFMQWLEGQVDKGILEVGRMQQLGEAVEGPWTNMYITDSYKRGVIRARYEMGQAGYPVPSLDETGGISASMNQPIHIDRLGLIHTRVYEELKGVTAQMDTQISRVLAEGMAHGDGPALLARKINSTISGKGMGELGLTDTLGRFIPAERRAKMIARTEVIRAHHIANINEYRAWRVEGVQVQAEFRTAEDDRVCDECERLENTVHTLDEAENLIPVHPNCRCIVLPTQPKVVPVGRKPAVPTGPTYTKARAAEMRRAIRDRARGRRSDPIRTPSLWQEANTIEDAIKQLQDKLYVKDVVNLGAGNVSDAHMLRNLNIIGRTIADDVIDRMPQLRRRLDDFARNVKGVSVRRDALKKTHRRWQLFVQQDRGSVTNIVSRQDVAGYYHNGFGRITLPGQRTPGHGFRLGQQTFAVADDLATITRHEYGHYIYQQRLYHTEGINYVTGQWNPMRAWMELWTRHQDKISKYAKTNVEEGFAEAFAAWTHPGYGRRGVRLPSEIEEFFTRIFM